MPHRVLAASFPALTIAALAVSASMAGTCGDPILGPELVLNGSFESASYSGCANSCFASCGFSVANWIRGGFYTEDLARNSPDGCEYQPFNPNGGEYYISVQGSVCCGCNNNGSIRQDIAVVAGQTYLVELDIVIDEYDSVQLSIGGVVETISPATTATMEWTRVSRVVQCVSSGGQIRIAATGSPSAPNCLGAYYSYIDNVSVRQIVGTNPCPDCNADGISDAEQVARGELADYDGSGVPDCCESGDSCVVGNYPVQWREADGGNGHWYWARASQQGWQDAQSAAEALRGHLVTVTTDAEHQFVKGLWQPASPGRGVWAGGKRVKDPSCDALECEWEWVTGEPWGYTAWTEGEPNNDGGAEDRLEILRTLTVSWNDEPGATLMPSIVEWSADCNGDGQVDYGQILRGELADANGDYVPDECVFVPGDYPTIQSAIDAAPADGPRSIVVAAGTYVEAINFLGKRVRVAGAGADLTVIAAPAGLKSSVVRATGEPAGAVLEGVTVRGGQTGTTLPNAGFVRVGGGIFADESALALKGCTVEDNAGGFGGGAYFRRCTGSIRGCTFRGNDAGADGGAFQMIWSTMLVEDTVVTGNFANSRAGGIHVVGGDHTLRRVTISDNSSGNIVGGLSFVWLDGFPPPLGRLLVEDCVIEGNAATVSQGGIGILDETPADVQISLKGTQVCSNAPAPNITGTWTDLGGNDICDCRTDVNLDGRVDGIDLATLLSQWGPATASTTCDFNASGSVDAADLSFMLAAWGDCGG